jgi:hypothetical protein
MPLSSPRVATREICAYASTASHALYRNSFSFSFLGSNVTLHCFMREANFGGKHLATHAQRGD